MEIQLLWGSRNGRAGDDNTARLVSTNKLKLKLTPFPRRPSANVRIHVRINSNGLGYTEVQETYIPVAFQYESGADVQIPVKDLQDQSLELRLVGQVTVKQLTLA